MQIFARLVFGGALCASAGITVGCASNDPQEQSADVGGPYGVCNAVVQQFEITSATHVEECSELAETSSPPAGGSHYPAWAAFQTYTFPVAHGYLIHSMEHGAVVFYYNCPNGCDAEVKAAEELIADQPVDSSCTGTGSSRRAILLPDPSLDVKWAASAWGFTLRADCFDPDVFKRFYTNHYAKAPEDLCVAGRVFTSSPCETQ
ncbi:MAG: DUF3105 domain-containing protein [Myxococcota bacterium]